MKLRPLLVSIAVLAPLSAAVWWFSLPDDPRTPEDSRVNRRIIEPAALEPATRVELKSEGASLVFARNESGRWVVEGTPALPADLSRLARLSNDLSTPKIERFVSARPEKIAGYELDKTSVIYRDASGNSLLDLRLGKTTEGGGRIVSFADEKRAYLARLSVALDPEPTGWRDTALLAGLSASDIAAVRIGFATTSQPVTVSREKADQPWTSPSVPAGQRVKTSLLTTQTGNLATLRFTAIAPNLDPGVVAARVFPREIAFTTFAGRTVTLSFSRAPEPPAPPATPQKEGETPPPAAPRPVYVSVTDSQPDALLSEAAKTHTFEVADWIFTALPASPADLFEADPSAAAPSSEPVSVTTPPVTAPAASGAQAP